MGNTSGKNKEPAPDLSAWELKERHNNMNVWRNKSNPKLQLEEYPLYFNDEKQFNREKTIYFLRKDHPALVSSQYFQQEKEEQFCSSVYKGNIFLERIPIRLSNVTEIPYPDILHLHNQSLRGFEALSKEIGSFHVDEDNFGFTPEGIAKVWMHKDFEKTFPSESKCSQQNMVRNILEKVESNTDPEVWRRYPSILNFIYSRNSKVGFKEAISSLEEYAKMYNNGHIPQYLSCVRKVGTEALIQQYNINNLNNMSHNSFPVTQQRIQSSETIAAQPTHTAIQYQQVRTPMKVQSQHFLANSPPLPPRNQKKMTIIDTLNGGRIPTQISGSGVRSSEKHATVVQSSFAPKPQTSKPYRFVPILQTVDQRRQAPPMSPPLPPMSLPPQTIVQARASVPVQRSLTPQVKTQNENKSHTVIMKNEQHVRSSVASNGGNIKFVTATSPVHQPMPAYQQVVRQENRTKTIVSSHSAAGERISNVVNKINQSPGQVSYTSSNQRSPQHQRQDSISREAKTITTTSQIVPNNEFNAVARFGFDEVRHREEMMNAEIPVERRSFNAQSSERNTSSNVPEISELSSIGHQVSFKNNKYMSEKPFSEIRGESINNSTVQFYNSYMNKDQDQSQVEWQDYTQAHQNNSPALRPRVIVESESKYGGSSEKPYVAYNVPQENFKDGTSSDDFWKKLNSVSPPSVVSYSTQQYQTNYPSTSLLNSNAEKKADIFSYEFYTSPNQGLSSKATSSNAYQATYDNPRIDSVATYNFSKGDYINGSYEKKQTYGYSESKYSYQNNQENIGITDYQYVHAVSPPKNLDELSGKLTQSPQDYRTFQADSFGVSEEKARHLEDNIDMKYSMTQQQEEYKVEWDPEILADLQNMQH